MPVVWPFDCWAPSCWRVAPSTAYPPTNWRPFGFSPDFIIMKNFAMNIFVYILGVIYIFMMYFESICQSELLVCMLILNAYLFETGFHQAALADLDLTVEPRRASNCSNPPVCLPSVENVGLYHYVFLTPRKYVNSMIEIMVQSICRQAPCFWHPQHYKLCVALPFSVFWVHVWAQAGLLFG